MSTEKDLNLNEDETPIEGTEPEEQQTTEEAEAVDQDTSDGVEIEETAIETVSEEPVAEEVVIEEPVAKEVVIEEPVVEEPVAEEVVIEEPVAEEVVIEEPVVEEPVAEEEVVEEPVAEEVVAEEDVVEEPVAEEAVAEEVVAEEALDEKPVAEKALDEEPVAEESFTEAEAEAEAEAPAKRAVRSLVPDASFDWDSIGKKQDIYSKDVRSKLEGLYDKTLTAIAEHQVIDGTLVSLGAREAVVNIGYKSDGVIPMGELRYNPNLKAGDLIEVYVENQEDLTGQLVLSHKKARILRSWDRVNEAMEKDEIINGFVKCRTKGGLIVDVFGIEAFLPGSQIDVKPIRDYDIYVGKTMEFKVVKINQEFKNVVVSHKALIQDELEKQKADIISKLEKGQILEGTVKNITSYGVFIDLGGVDGLIHITDLSWGRIEHPDQIVELDQKINVVILDFDDLKKRIALGLKQLQPHPWESLDANLKVGDKVKGKVVVIADYGAFVEIVAGVEGLVHVSEMSWSQHLRTAQDFLKVGDSIDAVILTLDREDRKMSLGIKQLIPDPWSNIVEKYPLNSRHTAVVRNFTNFGIFVELEEGVDGLIHISDLSWQKKIKHPAEFTKIGESIEVVVLEVDVENRRLSLGHKQLEENPWDVFETVFTIDSVHKGTVSNIVEKGAIITLPYGVEGFSPIRHLSKENGSVAKVDDTLDFKVIEFSRENRKIIVSHSRTFQDVQVAQKVKEETEEQKREKATKRHVKKIKDSLEKTTLGDLGVLAGLRTELRQEEMDSAKAKLEQMEEKQLQKKTTKKKAAPPTEDKPKKEEEAPEAESSPAEE